MLFTGPRTVRSKTQANMILFIWAFYCIQGSFGQVVVTQSDVKSVQLGQTVSIDLSHEEVQSPESLLVKAGSFGQVVVTQSDDKSVQLGQTVSIECKLSIR
ncbi:hypothetical protein cypCar_00002030 [Cyprinus carpio]|nr:hypothetical protein cypCar_00002030 [Cyprinus carpio]